MSEPQNRLIIDDDWKAQAEAAKAADSARLDSPAGTGSGGPQAADRRADFGDLVDELVLQAMAGLGLVADPADGKPLPAHLPSAQRAIDLLAVLKARTAGNLSAAEQAHIDRSLYELRMAFVQIMQTASSPSRGPGTAAK